MADAKLFARYTENNEHEGETWVFWLQYDGNEDALSALDDLIAEAVGDSEPEEYELDLDTLIPEWEVDTLVKHGGQGYMDYHHKVTGKLTLPSDLGEYLEDLYKGGVKKLFK